MKAKPSSTIEASRARGSRRRREPLPLAAAAALLVHALVERLQQRVQRLLALAQRLAALLEHPQVLGRVAAVRQPEQVEQALAPVGVAHRAERRARAPTRIPPESCARDRPVRSVSAPIWPSCPSRKRCCSTRSFEWTWTKNTSRPSSSSGGGRCGSGEPNSSSASARPPATKRAEPGSFRRGSGHASRSLGAVHAARAAPCRA